MTQASTVDSIPDALARDSRDTPAELGVGIGLRAAVRAVSQLARRMVPLGRTSRSAWRGHENEAAFRPTPPQDLCADPAAAASSRSLASFAQIPATRPARMAHRIVHVADLTPASGAADFLNTCITCAERQPDLPIELCWIGQGDLQGVLSAQPLPSNLHQTFAGPIDTAKLLAEFPVSGLLAVPTLSRSWPPYLLEAMAAGLAVIGSKRNPAIERLVIPLETGWLFDPLSPRSMLDSLESALATPPSALDLMREWARARAIGHQHAAVPLDRAR